MTDVPLHNFSDLWAMSNLQALSEYHSIIIAFVWSAPSTEIVCVRSALGTPGSVSPSWLSAEGGNADLSDQTWKRSPRFALNPNV